MNGAFRMGVISSVILSSGPPPTPPDLTWETATSWDPLTGSNESGWGGYTARIRVAAAELLAGPYLRMTLSASSAEKASVTECYVQTKGAGPFDFSASPVAVKVAGSTSFEVPASGSVVTDVIALPIDAEADLVIAVAFGVGTSVRYKAGVSGWSSAYKVGNDAATVIVGANYSGAQVKAILVSKIEIGHAE